MGMNLPTGEDGQPDTSVTVSRDRPRFGFPLPFDPLRLLAGVLSRWRWIVCGLLVGGTLGGVAGTRLTHQSFTLSVSLIKRRIPHTVQASEIGQAYRPVDLNDATLLATLLATEPLDLALTRSANQLDPNRVRSLVEAKQLEGTDIFYITYHSPVSAADAVAFTTIWAEEINAYTQRLQQSEAREVRLILQKEVTDLEHQLSANNLEILNFSKEKDYLGGEAQVAAELAKLAQVELQLETARTKATATEAQLKYYTEQIQRQSPIELQLKTVKEELANLRATYTDANPLVQTKLQSIEYLDGQIATLGAKGQADLEAYTGTPLGNSLYLSILGMRNEQLAATSQINSLATIYQKAASRLAEFPAIVSAYRALQKKATSISEGLTLMSNRLKEAEIFASGAPGYWQIFQTPDPRLIVPSSLVKKPAVMGIGGGLLGASLATLLTLLLSHRSVRRSVIECCTATRAPLVAHIPASHDADARAAIDHFWITHLAPRLQASGHILWWTPALDPADERRFWTMLAAAATHDSGHNLRIHDLTPDALWSQVPIPDGLEWLAAPCTPAPPATATLLRASGLPHGATRDLFAQVDHWLALVAGQQGSLRRAVEFRELCDAYLPPCNGTLAWTERPEGAIRERADELSCFLAKRFS